MGSSKCTIIFLVCMLGYQLTISTCEICSNVTDLGGTLEDSTRYAEISRKCWRILVPQDNYIRLNLHSVEFQRTDCSYGYVQITTVSTAEKYKLCKEDGFVVTALSDVTVESYIRQVWEEQRFALKYNIQHVRCAQEDNFRCDDHFCISRAQVCDGARDCGDGKDEVGCEKGILAIPEVAPTRNRSIARLKGKRTPSWGWREFTSRAIVALRLASAAANHSDLEEELMVKQSELRTTAALLRSPPMSANDLSLHVHGLVATCRNPRRFHGLDLVRRLREQVRVSSGNFTHPIAYLALCNANESWPEKAHDDLRMVLDSASHYPFVTDIQAVAVIAVSCMANNSAVTTTDWKNSSLLDQYRSAVERFKRLQLQDGSFGNLYSTALVAQALVSSGQELSRDWNLNATVRYLVREMNGSQSDVDVLATYLVLPLFSGKTLVDIFRTNCSGDPGRSEDDAIPDVDEYIGPKMRVRYSLFIGDQRDVVHSISLRVPQNFTAQQVMEAASTEDHKYKFSWKLASGKMYVYEIAGVTNDPEAGKFWLLYVGSANDTEPYDHPTTSPDKLVMDDGDHLVMWYKTAHI